MNLSMSVSVCNVVLDIYKLWCMCIERCRRIHIILLTTEELQSYLFLANFWNTSLRNIVIKKFATISQDSSMASQETEPLTWLAEVMVEASLDAHNAFNVILHTPEIHIVPNTYYVFLWAMID